MKKIIITLLISAVSIITMQAQTTDLKNLEMIDNEFDQGMATLNSEMVFRNAAPDCVYYGTDPTEKMDISLAKILLKNDLKNGKPTMKVVSKEMFPSADGNSAVFVKKVSWEIFKAELRQVCVYEKQRDGWKMKVWTLNMSIPNAKNEAINKLF